MSPTHSTRPMTKLRWLLATLALVLVAGPLSAQGYVVVVRADNPVTSLTKSKVVDIFLKRATRWDDGSVVIPVDLDAGDRARDAFSRQVHGKPVQAVPAVWQPQIFSGKQAPPAGRGTDEEGLGFLG